LLGRGLEKFFYENESNIFCCKLFFNPTVINNVGQQLEKSIFLGNRDQAITQSLLPLRIESFLTDLGRVKEKIDLEHLIPGLSRTEFLRLRTEINWQLQKYEFNVGFKNSAKSLPDFLFEIKRGSKRFRNMYSGRGSKIYRNFRITEIRPVRTMFEQLNIGLNDKLLSIGFTIWRMGNFDLDFRQFSFKMTQGLIHGNTVVSHFADVDKKCSFCKIVEKKPLQKT